MSNSEFVVAALMGAFGGTLVGIAILLVILNWLNKANAKEQDELFVWNCDECGIKYTSKDYARMVEFGVEHAKNRHGR